MGAKRFKGHQMKDYIILKEYSINDLQEKVNNLLALGYKPIGNLVVDGSTSSMNYFQAMLKDKQ